MDKQPIKRGKKWISGILVFIFAAFEALGPAAVFADPVPGFDSQNMTAQMQRSVPAQASPSAPPPPASSPSPAQNTSTGFLAENSGLTQAQPEAGPVASGPLMRGGQAVPAQVPVPPQSYIRHAEGQFTAPNKAHIAVDVNPRLLNNMRGYNSVLVYVYEQPISPFPMVAMMNPEYDYTDPANPVLTGRWSTDIEFPRVGDYKIIFKISPDGTEHVTSPIQMDAHIASLTDVTQNYIISNEETLRTPNRPLVIGNKDTRYDNGTVRISADITMQPYSGQSMFLPRHFGVVAVVRRTRVNAADPEEVKAIILTCANGSNMFGGYTSCSGSLPGGSPGQYTVELMVLNPQFEIVKSDYLPGFTVPDYFHPAASISRVSAVSSINEVKISASVDGADFNPAGDFFTAKTVLWKDTPQGRRIVATQNQNITVPVGGLLQQFPLNFTFPNLEPDTQYYYDIQFEQSNIRYQPYSGRIRTSPAVGVSNAAVTPYEDGARFVFTVTNLQPNATAVIKVYDKRYGTLAATLNKRLNSSGAQTVNEVLNGSITSNKDYTYEIVVVNDVGRISNQAAGEFHTLIAPPRLMNGREGVLSSLRADGNGENFNLRVNLNQVNNSASPLKAVVNLGRITTAPAPYYESHTAYKQVEVVCQPGKDYCEGAVTIPGDSSGVVVYGIDKIELLQTVGSVNGQPQYKLVERFAPPSTVARVGVRPVAIDASKAVSNNGHVDFEITLDRPSLPAGNVTATAYLIPAGGYFADAVAQVRLTCAAGTGKCSGSSADVPPGNYSVIFMINNGNNNLAQGVITQMTVVPPYRLNPASGSLTWASTGDVVQIRIPLDKPAAKAMTVEVVIGRNADGAELSVTAVCAAGSSFCTAQTSVYLGSRQTPTIQYYVKKLTLRSPAGNIAYDVKNYTLASSPMKVTVSPIVLLDFAKSSVTVTDGNMLNFTITLNKPAPAGTTVTIDIGRDADDYVYEGVVLTCSGTVCTGRKAVYGGSGKTSPSINYFPKNITLKSSSGKIYDQQSYSFGQTALLGNVRVVGVETVNNYTNANGVQYFSVTLNSQATPAVMGNIKVQVYLTHTATGTVKAVDMVCNAARVCTATSAPSTLGEWTVSFRIYTASGQLIGSAKGTPFTVKKKK